MTSTLETLQKARELISDPRRWTQKSYAHDALGYDALPDAEEAVCFCAIGAIHKVGDFAIGSRLPVGLTALLVEDDEIATSGHATELEGWVTDFNDLSNHADVLGLFDRAIEKAKASQGAEQ